MTTRYLTSRIRTCALLLATVSVQVAHADEPIKMEAVEPPQAASPAPQVVLAPPVSEQERGGRSIQRSAGAILGVGAALLIVGGIIAYTGVDWRPGDCDAGFCGNAGQVLVGLALGALGIGGLVTSIPLWIVGSREVSRGTATHASFGVSPLPSGGVAARLSLAF